MGINADEVLRLLKQKQETRGERIARLVAEKRAQQGGSATVVSSVPEATAAQEDDNRFFKAGAFSDGYQFGDVVKTILGTAGDIGINAVKGAGSLVEGVTDLLGYAGAGIADLVGADEFASDWKKSVQQNTVDAIFKGAEDYVDQASVLGGRSDAISQGLGQVAAILLTGGAAGAAGLGTAGATALTTAVTGLSGMGSGMSQAYQEGATDGEAVAYGAISGTAEALTELIFAGMGKSVKALGFSKGLSSADDILAKKLSSKISSQLGKNLVELGVKAGAEGTEEVMSGIAQALGKKLTYMSEEDLGKIVKDERLFDQFLTGAITSGIAQSGIVPGMKAGSFREANKTGRDLITGLTQNEQAVVDKVYADRVAERKKSGELSKKQEAEIYDKVLEDMEQGRISTDTIESVLGGDTYKGYQSMLEQEAALKDEIKTLVKTPREQFTVEQSERLAEARKELEGLDTKTAKDNLFSQVDKLTANDTKLRESYNERTRRGQAFTADLSQYDEKLRPTIQRAIDNGEINNTRATHAFVEGLAKIEAEKGIGFDFTNNQRLAELGLTVAGRNVGGYVDGTNVTLNLSSSEALNKVVGHEVTHVFEGSGQYDALMTAMKEFAAEKGIDWDARVYEMTERYQNVKNADPEKELLADLVGEYLFTDSSFVENLSTKNPGLFKRIYEEIKYLAKTFAGTKQGAALEKVKKTFAEMYRDVDIKNTAQTDGVKYSINTTENGTKYVKLDGNIFRNEDGSSMTPREAYNSLVGQKITLEDGDVITFIKKLPKRDIYKELFLKLPGYEDGIDVKAVSEKINRNIVEVITASQAQTRNEAQRHPHIGIKDFDQREVYLADDSDAYRLELCIANLTDGTKIAYVKRYIEKASQEIAKEIKKAETAEQIRLNQPSNVGSSAKAEDSPTTHSIRNPGEKVNGKFSLSETKDTAPAGSYRITGEDIALAPTREDIAQMEQKKERIATAQDAPRNDVEELGASTREDIANQERDKKLEGPLLMKDSLDRELEKLYRLQQTGQIQGDAYFLELFKVNAAYQEAGRNFNEAFSRVYDAYQGESVSGAAFTNAKRILHPKYSEADISENKRKLANMEAVHQINATKLEKTGKKPSTIFAEYFERLGNNISSERFGDIALSNSSVKSEVRHGITAEKIASIEAIPNVIESGEVIFCGKKKGSDVERIVVAAPIKIGDKPYYMGVMLQRDSQNQRLYLHNVQIEEEVSNTPQADLLTTGADGANENLFITSILQDAMRVKYSLDQSATEDLGAPTREDIARMEAEKELHGPWRMEDPLDQKVEKLYRMMLREQVSEEDYIAQLVKADRQYQQRGSKVEEALERVREAYSKETTETPETEKKMERLTRKVLHKGIMDRIRDALAKAGFDLNAVLKNAKNLSTFATVDNTPQRVNEKTFGYKAGQVINDLTVNKAALNESDGIQWLNGQIDKIRKMSERYGIKPDSKEDRAAQIYGEGFWVNEVGEYIQYGDAELAADFPDTEKQAKIKALAKSQEVRQMYDDTLDAINAARVRNGYPPIPRRDNYFLHFRAQEDTFSRIGVPFNPNDVRAKDLPTDLNGVTADLKPGKPFFASEMHRTGDKTTYALLGGLERYMNSAKNQIYHIDDIQTFRAMRNYIADMFGQANGLADLDNLSPEEQEQRIKEVFDNHLSTYAKFLNEEANIFAGKTALIDRGVEGVLGRRAIQFLHTLNGQVGKNMVGYNISSAGTNVLPVVQATAMLPKVDMVKAFAQTISNKFRSDGFVESDPALIRRRGADQFAKTPWQRISDPGYALMSAVDNLSSELIVRAKYNELTRKGMDSQQAHIRAGEWASRLMGDRSLGQMPQLYNSKTLGLITKFQLEVRNQLDAMGYDVIQEAKAEEGASNAKKAAKVASTMAQLAIFQHLFGQAYEAIAGYNPAFDIVENLIKLFGFDDDEESEDTVGDNVEQAFLGLLEDLPYTSTFTGGRIPIASALPVKEVITGKDSYGNEKNRLETLAEALPYYILPGGYGQAKKTVQGIKMFDEDLPVAGSYTDSGNLRFPVEEASIADWLQAALFGQYASKNAREYFNNGWAPLKEKQIDEFAALDIPIADYREIRKQLGKLETTGEKFDYIDGLDLTVEQKNILVNNVVNRQDPVDMTDYDMYEDFEEFDFYTKNQEKYQFLQDNGIAYKTYNASEESREAYNWAFQNPEKYQVSRAVTEDTVVYKEYTKELSAIKSDKDNKGNAVSGSRKKKVVQYINGLDLEYGAKLVLYKMEYPSDDSYNGKIIEYVNGIDGFTFEQKANVLQELGFTVSSDGRVTWN